MNKINRLSTLGLLSLSLLPLATAQAQQIVIQPLTEATSKDAKIYKSTPGDSIPSDLAVSDADIGFSSLLQFDLSQLAATNSNQIVSATITLYVAGVSTSMVPAAGGGPISLRPITSEWREETGSPGTAPVASYNGFFGIVPTITLGNVLLTQNVTSIGFVDFDVTALVKQWVSGSLANNGVFFESNGTNVFVRFADVDYSPTVPGSSPKLTVTVPEPSTALLLGCAGSTLLLRRRRRTAPTTSL